MQPGCAAVDRSRRFRHALRPPKQPIWALGSISAGAEPRGTCMVPSGCSVTGLTRTTCKARARPRGCARRGFSPNVSDRLPGSSGPTLVAGRSRVDGGRSLLLRGAARAAHGPGEGHHVGQIGRPKPLAFSARRNLDDAAPSPMAAPMFALCAVPAILQAGTRARR